MHKTTSNPDVAIPIPKDAHIDSTNLYNGIYELTGKSIKKHKSITFNNLIFVTTSEDLGDGIRGYLYVFNTRNKLLIRDTTFKRDYLYSSAGIFIIDSSSQRICSIDKPEWYDEKQEGIIPASIARIKGAYFDEYKTVYKVGEDIPEDSSLVSFFNEAIAGNSKEVLDLPKDWWKIK
ncbi:hypothetical protein [Dinghuibacter silviterrae]|nr:hypothetical protein [Dinghuibacter silviterrae]